MEKIGYFNIVGSNVIPGNNSFNDLIFNLKFEDRNIVEEMEGCLQIVCAACFLTANGKVLTINKTAKSTGKISPEKNKTLLYVGSHLDKLDFVEENIIETLKNGMKREVFEELELSVDTQFDPYVIYTPITEKSAKHLGVIFPVLIEKEFAPNFQDGKARFIEICDVNRIDNLESWSQIIGRELTTSFIDNSF